MKHLTALAALACLAALPALAQESFKSEYISGKAGMDKQLKGILVITETEIRFTDDKGATLITVPMNTLTEAKATREHESGSVGRKLMLGGFASKNQEYLELDFKTDKEAGAYVFKTEKKQSAQLAEKIKFYMEKAGKKK